MSGNLRKKLAPAKSRLIKLIKDTWTPHPLIDDTIRLAANLEQLRLKKRHLLENSEKLLHSAESIQGHLKEWESIIGEQDDPTEEQDIFDEWTSGEDGLNETLMEAGDKHACLKAWQSELEQEKQSLLLQSAMEERDQQTELERRPPRVSEFQASVNKVEQTAKLAPIHLPTFGGDIKGWFEFYDIFAAFVHKTTLAPVQKFIQLKGLLKGRALSVIEGIPITNDNYELALKILKDKFGNKDSLRKQLYSDLSNMSPITAISCHQLGSLMDNLEKCLRQLEAMGEDTEQAFIASTIRDKLNQELLVKLEEIRLDQDSEWTVKSLRENLTRILSVREKAAQAGGLHKVDRTVSQSFTRSIPPNWRCPQKSIPAPLPFKMEHKSCSGELPTASSVKVNIMEISVGNTSPWRAAEHV